MRNTNTNMNTIKIQKMQRQRQSLLQLLYKYNQVHNLFDRAMYDVCCLQVVFKCKCWCYSKIAIQCIVQHSYKIHIYTKGKGKVLWGEWIALDWSQVTTGARRELATEVMAWNDDDDHHHHSINIFGNVSYGTTVRVVFEFWTSRAVIRNYN